MGATQALPQTRTQPIGVGLAGEMAGPGVQAHGAAEELMLRKKY